MSDLAVKSWLMLFAQQIVLLYKYVLQIMYVSFVSQYLKQGAYISLRDVVQCFSIAWCRPHIWSILFLRIWRIHFVLKPQTTRKKNVSLSKDKLDETATFNFTCEHPDAYKTMREFMPKTFGAECFVSGCLSLCVKVWQCEISIPHVLLPTSFDWLTDEIIVFGCVACFFIIHFHWYLDCVGV